MLYISTGYNETSISASSNIITVNVDIFVQLNFHASSPRRHIRVILISHTYHLILFVLL